MKKIIKLPKFKNEDEERKFWNNVDLSKYFEPDDFVRIPEYLIDRIKERAGVI